MAKDITELLPQQGKLSKTSWQLPDNLAETDWQAAGLTLEYVKGASNWWLGGWWRYGEAKYGDRKALVTSDDWEGPALQTCMNVASVCRVFETSHRREVLSFKHHAGPTGERDLFTLTKGKDMRQLDIGLRRYTTVIAVDEPGTGGACHEYHVIGTASDYSVPAPTFAVVKFQQGFIQESGINGCTNEDILAIVIDRLRGFQQDKFSCRENALALTNLEEALHWLRRAFAVPERGVEGTYAV